MNTENYTYTELKRIVKLRRIMYASIMLVVLAIGVGVFYKMIVHFNTPVIEQKVVDNLLTPNYGADYTSVYVYDDKGNISFDSTIDYKNQQNQIKYTNGLSKPYRLTTSYKDTSYTDYGTFREIDSIKCIRFSQMTAKIKSIDSTTNYNTYKFDHRNDELDALNKPCNN